ncbi:MAG: Crp/Fnr family transcriptional regulator [Halioglobus sp.]
MTEIDRQAIVARSPWFVGLPERALEALALAAQERELEPGDCIYRQGFPTTEVYCVVEGRVRVSLHSPNGHEFALIEREPETWFGEPGLLNDEGRVLEASAIESVKLLAIPREVVLELGEQYPLMYKNLFHYNMQTLRTMHQLVGGILFYPLQARVAGRLLYLLDGHGQQTDEGVLLDIKVSQNDFARLALGSRQRVNKVFRDWNRRGLVENRNDFLLIRDREQLEEEIRLFE